MAYCINCGKELVELAKFCPECGTKVESPNTSVNNNQIVEFSNPTIKEEDIILNEVIELYFGTALRTSKVYLGKNIPEQKLNAFLNKYQVDSSEYIQYEYLVYYDDTFWGKGDDGYLIYKTSSGTLHLLINIFRGEQFGFAFEKIDTWLHIRDTFYSNSGWDINFINADEILECKTVYFEKKPEIEALYNFYVNYFLDDVEREISVIEKPIEEIDPSPIKFKDSAGIR